MVTAAVLFMAPAGPAAWTHADAQTLPKPSGGDRIFLKIDGVEGEATESDHVGDLNVRSFNWGESRAIDSSAKAQIKDFHVVTALDKASPLLMRKTAVRDRISKAVLTIRNSLGQDYTKWTLGDIVVTGLQIEGTAGQGKPEVSFDLNFSKIDAEYRAQLYNGGLSPAVKASWDAKGG